MKTTRATKIKESAIKICSPHNLMRLIQRVFLKKKSRAAVQGDLSRVFSLTSKMSFSALFFTLLVVCVRADPACGQRDLSLWFAFDFVFCFVFFVFVSFCFFVFFSRF